MKYVFRWLLATFVCCVATAAHSQGSQHCDEFGNQRFCTSKNVHIDIVFRDCWSKRAAEIEQDRSVAKADWLWPAADAAACMAATGVTSIPATAPEGKVFCGYLGNAGPGKMVKWCKAGARGDEALRMGWDYCVSVGLVLYEDHVMPSTGNDDPDALVGYIPCMRAQSWTGAIVDMSKERPRSPDQHVGAKGSI